MEPNTLYYGDCLDWMSRWPDECVDLIYLDPPFNSNATYNMLYSAARTGAQYRAFTDTWTWDEVADERFRAYQNASGRRAYRSIIGLGSMLGESGMLAYLTYMAERLEQMHRLLKPSGSLYFHCDPTASHGLKLVLDGIFGSRNFRREIVWDLQTASGYKAQVDGFIRGHDTIFYYVKGGGYTFNKHYREHKPEYVARFNKEDEDGRSYRDDRPGKRRQYLDETPGVALTDVWSDVMSFQQNSRSKELLGYPTQKPRALLERIIESSTNAEDIVLDPFCGCGTAIEAAHKTNRRWVGIDISSFAIDLIRHERMKGMRIPARGIPQDLQSARQLAKERPFDFESWAVTRLPGFAPNTRQVADGGVDGRAMIADEPEDFDSRLALAQVKGGMFGLSQLRDFKSVAHRDKAALSYYITLEPVTTRAAKTEAAGLGTVRVLGQDFRRMSLWPISDYFDGRLPPMPYMTDPYTGKRMLPLPLYGHHA